MRIYLGFLVLLFGVSAVSTSAAASPPHTTTVEASLSMEMLALEAPPHDIRSTVDKELRAVLAQATGAARASGGPSNITEAKKALAAIQKVMCQHGYRQPPRIDGWPDTIVQALTSHVSPDADSSSCPGMTQGDFAGRFAVDCDIGAQIFISVGQLLGWDIRLVNEPKHSFVRWLLPDGQHINWDWTSGASYADDHYALLVRPLLRGINGYGKELTPTQARAYYIGQIGSDYNIESLLREAIRDVPSDSLTQNNVAYFFATHRVEDSPSAAEIVGLAMAALSARPDDPDIIDTLACAQAAAGQLAISEALIVRALALKPKDSALLSHLDQIRQSHRCAPDSLRENGDLQGRPAAEVK